MSNFYLGKAEGWAKIIVGGIEDTTLKLLTNRYKYLVTAFTSRLLINTTFQREIWNSKISCLCQYGELIGNSNILILSNSTCFTKALV